MTNSDKVIEILRRTCDGRNLYQSPEMIERHGPNGDDWQLDLVQAAVNGHLSSKGQILFDALHRQILAVDYKYGLRDFVELFCPEVFG